MNIDLKLIPNFEDNFLIDQECLKIAVTFAYEDIDRSFVFNVTNGLNIIGKVNPETQYITYFIGDVCTLGLLGKFINDLSKGNPCSIVFGEEGGSINCIEYNPVSSTWTHKTDSHDLHVGGSLSIKLTPETLKKFVHSLETYRRFACIQIEGHKRLFELEHNDIMTNRDQMYQ